MSDWLTPEEREFIEDIDPDTPETVSSLWLYGLVKGADARIRELENDNAHLKAIVGKCSEPGAPTYDEIVAESDRSRKRASEAEAKFTPILNAGRRLIEEINLYSQKQPIGDTNIHCFKRLLHVTLDDAPAAAQAVAEVLAKSEVLARGLNEAWNRNNGREKLFDVQGIGPLVNLARGIIAALDKEPQ